MEAAVHSAGRASFIESGSWTHVHLDSLSQVMEAGEMSNDITSLEAINAANEEWGDSSRLLFQPGYLKVIKEMALSGQLQQYNIRSICWRLFLGCLPEDQSKWVEVTQKSRDIFAAIKKKHIIDPHNIETGKDLGVHNPLSLDDDSPWNQYFQDNDLKQLVNQDVVRTFPDVQFFRQAFVQKMMLDLLFCYSREHEDLCYRQGMHEILAPILFVLNAELRDKEDTSIAPIVRIIMDTDFIEHDAYTIFSELMESMGPWYMSTALEADFYRARAQNRKKMAHDPRTNKPFEGKADFTPTSAISRKLGVIHNLHLKNADELLFVHLKDLSIPAQTYGIRWIRLLFGREFPLPSVLELWDALFADGPSLGLVDYMCVAMLMHIRDVLIEGDYAMCMQYLMRFPPVYEVNYLVQRALHFRNPSSFPSPRIWSHRPNTKARSTLNVGGVANNTVSSRFNSSLPASTDGSIQVSTSTGHTGTASKASKASTRAKEVFTKQIPKALSNTRISRATTGPRLEFHSKSRSRSPSPSRHAGQPVPIMNHPLQLAEPAHHPGTRTSGGAGESNKPKGRGRIIGATKSNAKSSAKEMSENPKSTSQVDGSVSQLDKLTNRIDDLQAKCLYCGGKADSLISSMQEEIIKLEGLPPETENTLLLSLAGLKQVRDLLLNKIPFSGEVISGWESAQRSKTALEDSDSVSESNSEGLSSDAVTKNNSTAHSSNDVIASKVSIEANRTTPFSVPMAGALNGNVSSDKTNTLQASFEVGTDVLTDVGGVEVETAVLSGSVPGVEVDGDGDGASEDWVSLSTDSHPLGNHPLHACDQ